MTRRGRKTIKAGEVWTSEELEELRRDVLKDRHLLRRMDAAHAGAISEAWGIIDDADEIIDGSLSSFSRRFRRKRGT